MSSGASCVLVIGSGGREHALAWKLSQSPRVARVLVAPGNDGMPVEWTRLAPGPLEPARFRELARAALAAGVDLAVIGPDDPLAAGIADAFRAEGLLTFGPSAAAARLEASKAFAKEVMTAAGVPTAKFVVVDSIERAHAFLRETPWGDGWVIKADGLALGKGVVVCASREEALSAASNLMALSGSLVIEERLSGEELSWMAFCDGNRAALLEPARDYKRVSDNDQGPNTGGMGAISPVSGIPESFYERVRREVFQPVLDEMNQRGTPFQGLLYAGLMVDLARDKIWVIEFNARFGDPETQVLLPRVEGDLLDWCEASALGDLSRLPSRVPFLADTAVVVVGAAKGYPSSPESGRKIEGLRWEAPEGARVFWAGVKRVDGELVSSGGRVFGALGLGRDLEQARSRAYVLMKQVSFQGMQYRRDIGYFGERGTTR